MLIYSGADFEKRNKNDTNAVLIASMLGRFGFIELFTQYGLNVKEPFLFNKTEFSYLDIASLSYLNMLKKGLDTYDFGSDDSELIRSLVGLGIEIIFEDTDYVKTVEILIKNGANPNGIFPNNLVLNPIMYSIIGKNPDVLRTLLKLGANKNQTIVKPIDIVKEYFQEEEYELKNEFINILNSY